MVAKGEPLNLTKLDQIIQEKYKKCFDIGREAIKSSTDIDNLSPFYDYCKYLKKLYDEGYIGYMMFAFELAHLVDIEAVRESKIKDLRIVDIAHFGCSLEVPDFAIGGGAEARKEQMKELMDLINSL